MSVHYCVMVVKQQPLTPWIFDLSRLSALWNEQGEGKCTGRIGREASGGYKVIQPELCQKKVWKHSLTSVSALSELMCNVANQTHLVLNRV